MTFASMGSLEYLTLDAAALVVFVLIYCLTFPPISGPKDTNDAGPVGETDRENAAIHFAKTKVTLLCFAVCDVFGDDALRISKCILSLGKGNAMFLLVFLILARIPLKTRLFHEISLAQDSQICHINVWH
jgi:hypothetical protein